MKIRSAEDDMKLISICNEDADRIAPLAAAFRVQLKILQRTSDAIPVSGTVRIWQ